ncbi:hypothetical protein CNE_BB1p01110 (plasmid) [Cupriavidus necator N-1]|uniref:Uncharacterized protein n=1 Tax=Cupriavidus necator (strain ATCC 43291 / DSM 13513 / CCUG 52238 / LMG 8453 / N-1) TaxID=1042878 RepID=F8GVH9_CUPNN|nr:hypothetical protein CNE_BB1p01110 [Cupriavidus necator N-1]
MSAEADIYPLNAIDKADAIDAAIGEGSRFHETYGYYAQGVGPETACLPAGWQRRLQRIQTADTNGRVGYCLDVVDLFMAKAVAARDKDRVFCMALIQYGYVSPRAALSRVEDMPIEKAAQGRLRARIKRWTKALRDQGHAVPDGDA